MLLPNRDACTGCGACAAACPKDCILMDADSEGFLYPKIDKTRCVDCKKCEAVCPVLKPPGVSKDAIMYATQNRDFGVRQESSSGGVFTALAERMIREGGAVCAAIYNEKFAVEHKLAFALEEIVPMRGAKYAQSYAGHLFAQLKALLEDGKPVMYVGTPCQCAGLRTYLNRDYDQLLLVDMICHGVPSPAVWREYLNRRRTLDADGTEIASINHRDKSTGWSRYSYSVMFRYINGDSYSVLQGQDPYMRGFVGDLYLRPSCSECSFKGIHRCSDLTLGDCWGIWDTNPEFDDNKGTSLLLIHSDKGQKMWDSVSSQFRSIALGQEEVIKCNTSAISSSSPHPRRTEFFARFHGGEPVNELILDILSPEPPKMSFIRRLGRRILKRQ